MIRFACVVLLLLKVSYHHQTTVSGFPQSPVNCPPVSYEFEIKTEWNGVPINKTSAVKIRLEGIGTWLRLEVEAPFYNDTAPPNGKRGQPQPELYNYEVVEAFFMNDEQQYLEVELAPHGEHLLLMLNGRRNTVVQQLPMYNIAKIKDDTWKGVAYIDNGYFPPDVTQFNAYAIHGSGDLRTYLALYPAPQNQFQRPDFHRLEFFKDITLDGMPPFKDSNVRIPKLWNMFPPHAT